MQTRTERKQEATRLNIIDTAMHLIRRHGIEAVTMEQIAGEADIAKGTLYNYFPVKEAILSEYIQRSFAEKNESRLRQMHDLADTRARLTLLLEELMQGIQEYPQIFEKYLVYQVQRMLSLRREAGVQSGMRQLAEAVVRLGQESGELRRDLPFDILASLVEFVFIEVAQQYYQQPEAFNAQEVIAQCVDLFLNGIRAS